VAGAEPFLRVDGGASEVCSACEERVELTQTLYEWQSREVGKMRMHVRSYEMWNVERVRSP